MFKIAVVEVSEKERSAVEKAEAMIIENQLSKALEELTSRQNIRN